MWGRFIAAAIVLTIATPSAAQKPAVAISSTPRSVTPPSTAARLDALLANKDYMALSNAVFTPPDAATLRGNLDWLRDRMRAGSTSLVAIMYARLLLKVTADMPEPSRTNMRDTAALAALYAHAAIEIDGQRCGDRTAPAHRQQQALALPGLLDHLLSMNAVRRTGVVDGALMTERVTAATRDAAGDVAFVCVGGLEETTYNLRHGTAKEVAANPGQVGRQIALSGDGNYRPSERPENEWRPAMARAREQSSSRLRAIASSLTKPPPAPPRP